MLAQDAIRRATRARRARQHLLLRVREQPRDPRRPRRGAGAPTCSAFAIGALATFLLDFLRALITMRAQRIDTIIDMEFFSRASAMFAFLSGASTRVGLHRFTGELPYRGDLMTHRVQYTPHLHVSLLYVVLVEAAFQRPHRRAAAQSAGRADRRRRVPAARRSSRRRPRPTQMRALVGGAATRAPRHPAESQRQRPAAAAQMGERASSWSWRGACSTAFPQSRASCVTGAPAERAAADQLCRAIDSPRAVSAAGQTSLRELLTLYTLASVLVTNDSGPAHFASLTPVHTVVLFGPETPLLFGSLQPGDDDHLETAGVQSVRQRVQPPPVAVP